MQQWFNSLQRQEQLLVAVGAFFVVLYIVYALMWSPMSKSIDILERKNEASLISLVNVKQLTAEYKKLKATGAKVSGSKQNFNSLINQTCKANQLTVKRIQPSSSGDVQVRFENSSFSNILAWLHQLENTHGVVVKDLSVNPGSNSGLVNISVRLRAGI